MNRGRSRMNFDVWTFSRTVLDLWPVINTVGYYENSLTDHFFFFKTMHSPSLKVYKRESKVLEWRKSSKGQVYRRNFYGGETISTNRNQRKIKQVNPTHLPVSHYKNLTLDNTTTRSTSEYTKDNFWYISPLFLLLSILNLLFI